MCGLSGLLAARPQALDVVHDMVAALAHRGPDGHAVAVGGPQGLALMDAARPAFGTLALGHNRLAIFDPSPRGAQPMSRDDGALWIVYNGEIYNHYELRAELETLGHTFHTGTDTEVVLAAWHEWGTECFARLNGMWAMAIADLRRGELVLCRDRLGIKPLYLSAEPGRLTFASEVKAILASRPGPARADAATLMRYVSHAALSLDDQTLFAGVRALPAGHFARVSLQDPDDFRVSRYWSLPPADESATAAVGRAALDEAAEQALHALRRSVALQHRSDVPVGIALSGGLDSTSLAAASRLQELEGMHAFTSRSPVAVQDESALATRVAQHFGLRQHIVQPDATGFLNALDAMAWHQETPPNSSMFAQWQVYASARGQGIPVMLSGQGADEVFCGYKKYYAVHLRALARQRRLAALAREAGGFARRGDTGVWRGIGLSRYLPAFARPELSLLSECLTPASRETALTMPQLVGADVPQMQRLDLTSTSLPALLHFEDRNAMAWGVENRVPYLDHELVELVLALPTAAKLAGGRTKVVLRHAMQDLLPDEIVRQRSKYNFFAPMRDWLKDGLEARVASELTQATWLAPLVDTRRILSKWQAHGAGRSAGLDELVFRLAMTALWGRRFGVVL